MVIAYKHITEIQTRDIIFKEYPKSMFAGTALVAKNKLLIFWSDNSVTEETVPSWMGSEDESYYTKLGNTTSTQKVEIMQNEASGISHVVVDEQPLCGQRWNRGNSRTVSEVTCATCRKWLTKKGIGNSY